MMNVVILEDSRFLLGSSIDTVTSDYSALLHIAWENEVRDRDRKDVRAIVTSSHKLTAESIRSWRDNYENLRVIALAFTGYDGVRDDARAECVRVGKRRIDLRYAPTYATDATARWAVHLMHCAVMQQRSPGHNDLLAGRWHDDVVPRPEMPDDTLRRYVQEWPAERKNVGIVGNGRIGNRVAELLQQSDPRCKVVRWSRRTGTTAGLIELLDNAPIVSLHLKLDHTTRRILNATKLAHMGPSSILINTARAGLIDNRALTAALEARQLFGAGVDVFENDHDGLYGAAISRDPLGRLAVKGTCNLTLTPHLGFKSAAGLEALARQSLDNVCRYERGDVTNRLPPASDDLPEMEVER